MPYLTEIDPSTNQSFRYWLVEKLPKKLETNVYEVPDAEMKKSVGIFKLVDGNIKSLTQAEMKSLTETMELESLAMDNRIQRNFRLNESDWIVAKSLEEGVDVPKNWKDYRTALRDLPKHTEWPKLDENDWPVMPTS